MSRPCSNGFGRSFAAVLSTVDALVLTEVYPAGEAPIAGADAKALARAIRTRGRVDPVVVGGAAELAGVLPDVLHDGDLLLLMGAGDIGKHAVEAATKYGNLERNDVLCARGLLGVEVDSMYKDQIKVVHETGVGFKFIGPKMRETDALIAGEESGGFGFGGLEPRKPKIWLATA